jgi:signal transduction histidine kinase/ligand-binding sensor domain-containing protein
MRNLGRKRTRMFCRPYLPTLVAWLILARTLAGAATAGDKPNTGTRRDYFNHWTSEHGIPHNRINALAQTSDGYLWIGTWRGLARFDGVRFVLFTMETHPEMGNDTVNGLTVDKEGTLWIGTEDGLLKYERGRFTRFTKSNGLPSRTVWRLVSGRTGGVWMDCGASFVHWEKDRPDAVVAWRRFPYENAPSMQENPDGSLTVLAGGMIRRALRSGELMAVPVPDYPGSSRDTWGGAVSTSDSLWINSNKALWHYRDGSWKEILTGNYRADMGAFMQVDQRGSLWVSRRDEGFWHCRGDSVAKVKLGDDGAEKSVICMLEDAEGHVWFGTGHGLFQLRPSRISTYTTEEGLPHNECHSVCEAPDGAVWVETKSGVGRLRGGPAETFSDEPKRDTWHAVLVDRRNTVWLGDRHNGLIAWNPGVETNQIWDAGRVVTVGALYLGRDGRVWVGTDRGATWFEDRQPATPQSKFILPSEGVSCLYQTRDGAMWFGTRHAGLVRWNAGAFQSGAGDSQIPPVKSVLSNAAIHRLRSVDVKAEGELFQRTNAASARFTRFAATNGLADDCAFVIHEDADGVMWIGTPNGLSRLTFPGPTAGSKAAPRFFTFRTEHGLLDNTINWLEEDDFGRFWFSCDRGIFRIDRQELNAVAEGRKRRANIAIYGAADGLISPATSGGSQPAGCKGRDGRLWFPTSQGLVVIDPRTIQDNPVSAPAVIEEVVADGQAIWADGIKLLPSETSSVELKLPPGRARVLKLRYTANLFADPRRVRFVYRLEGLDGAWREPTDERVAYYTDLKPGRYTFQVKAANPHGLWNEVPAEFAFQVAPHFWQTRSFYAGCAVGIVALVAGLQSHRLRGQRRWLELRQRHALEQERARIARDLHDDVGANLTGIALKADLAQRQIQSPPGAGKLADIAADARALVDNMRATVWALNPQHDTLEGLARFLAQQVEEFVTDAGLRCRLELPERFPELTVPSPARYHIHLLVKEALHNAVKHAGADEIQFSLKIDADNLCLRLADDGHGFDPANPPLSIGSPERAENGGHGLLNMRQRVDSLSGGMEIESNAKGTCVRIQIPTRSFQLRST